MIMTKYKRKTLVSGIEMLVGIRQLLSNMVNYDEEYWTQPVAIIKEYIYSYI